ncbi:DUF1697 domain-containing protein [Methanobrevibacter sp. TMH8]|uniref:DUF1697 domain-containing protein n=1 Tax=Methanobrevibacter sp. TMH8 TaxID=2848611 RepID=UPI001CCF00EC|nr:DUF1697 domain-containing protein [Methanobrevibacter sp. TMH8]MBZ9570502.1 DUF1697 domain-containing protein [Methanobrevibacter sp. TMH8]
MKYVAFLRGINVGKNKLIPMDVLKNIFLDMGFSSPKTYLRSGNVVFENNNDSNYNDLAVMEIANSISKNIEKFFGFYVEVIVKNKEGIDFLIGNNPYFDDNPIEKLYVTIFKNKIDEKLSKKLVKEFINLGNDDNVDEFTISKDRDIVYLLCKSKYHKTKFNNNFFESKLDNIATTRNWKTICKIRDMLN